MDGIVTVAIPLIRTAAYLSPAQADYYGGVEAAQKALKVGVIAEPAILAEQTIGELPWFGEVGHA